MMCSFHGEEIVVFLMQEKTFLCLITSQDYI